MTLPTPPAVPAGQPTPTAPAAGDPTSAAPTTTEPTTQAPAAGDPQPKQDVVLADLAKEREKRRALESEIAKSLGIELVSGGANGSHLAQITGKLAPLAKLAEALGGTIAPVDGKTEIEQITERLGSYETQLADERTARWRAELANEHKFTSEQAAELRGSTREELAAHAERLKTLFPTVPAAPGTPRVDPSQGGSGGSGVNLETQIAEAQAKGDWKTAMRLQNQKLAKTNP